MARAGVSERLAAEPLVRTARDALAGGPAEEIWIVGGAVRDALLRRPVTDLDLTVRGDSEQVARRLAAVVGGPVFPLSEAFGAWRVMDPGRTWTCDVTEMHGEGIDADLARRDFSVNAIAVPLAGGDVHDPQGGIPDLENRVLRVLGGPDVEHSAYADDPLRPLRMARFATELDLRPEPETERLTREAACCPSCTRFTGSSRATSTTSTCTTTRSRCCAASSRWSTIRRAYSATSASRSTRS
jgi:tRNA nucleotidyltransferase/poly(A) polymerase